MITNVPTAPRMSVFNESSENTGEPPLVGKAGERWVCRPIGGRYIGAGDGPPPASTGRKKIREETHAHNDRRRAELGQEHAPLPLAIGQRHEPEQPDDHHNGDGVPKSARDPIT